MTNLPPEALIWSNQLQGWAYEGEVAPYWHYFDPGSEVSLCGEVWMTYGFGRAWMDPRIDEHPAQCKRCEARAIQKYGYTHRKERS